MHRRRNPPAQQYYEWFDFCNCSETEDSEQLQNETTKPDEGGKTVPLTCSWKEEKEMKFAKMSRILPAVLAASLLSAVPALAGDIPEGKYAAQAGGSSYEFRNDGTVNYNGEEGIYRISEDKLTVVAGGYAYKYTFEIIDDLLLLYGENGTGLIYEKNDIKSVMQRIRSAGAGETVYLGSFEQDNNPENGKERIEWIVLDNDGEKALLISRYGLEVKAYNETYGKITWENCTLRAWLNEEFYNDAFTEEEQERILTTRVKAEDNMVTGTEAGNNTKDRIFLLSISEAGTYFGSNKARQCFCTEYVKGQDIYLSEYNNACWWWLRSPGQNTSNAACVCDDGTVTADGDNVDLYDTAVRPVLWVNFQR